MMMMTKKRDAQLLCYIKGFRRRVTRPVIKPALLSGPQFVKHLFACATCEIQQKCYREIRKLCRAQYKLHPAPRCTVLPPGDLTAAIARHSVSLRRQLNRFLAMLQLYQTSQH